MQDYAGVFEDLLSDLDFPNGCPDGHIFSDMDARTAAKVSLANSFYKKLCPDGNTTTADDAALIKFKEINCKIGELPRGFVANNEAESCFHDYFRDNLWRALDSNEVDRSFDVGFVRDNMNIGPGAAQKANADHMATKLFEGPVSYTDDRLISLYRTALSETGFWAEAEMLRNQKYGFVKVEGGKLFFAKKNAAISRTCCTEALLNMIVQKAVGAFAEQSLGKDFGIYLKSEPDFNRHLARIGSEDGTFGTIDLVSASDSNSLQLIERDLPPGAFKRWVMISRSQYAVLPDGSKVKLNMVSTMGNGFTFPLMTLIFACAVRAVYQVMDLPERHPVSKLRQFGVFGDDIVVRREAYDFLVKMLERLGYEVNVRKSFNTGSFRESCGHDYVSGVNIRGVYIRSLETVQDVCSAINRLARWSATHGVPLTRTLRRLWGFLDHRKVLLVPPSESDDAGLHVPHVLSKAYKVDAAYWYRYRKYVKRVRKFPIVEERDGFWRVTHEGTLDRMNPFGVATSFLSGHTRRRDYVLTSVDDTIWHNQEVWSLSASIRDTAGSRPRYKVATSSIPWWDYLAPRCEELSDPNMGSNEWSCPLTGASYDHWKSVVTGFLN